MFFSSTPLPMSGLAGIPAMPAISLDYTFAVGPLALLPIGLALALFLVLLVARDATRRFAQANEGRCLAGQRESEEKTLSRAA